MALLEQSKLHTTFLVMLTGLIVVVNSRVLCLAIQVVLPKKLPLQVIEGGLHYMDKPEGLMG